MKFFSNLLKKKETNFWISIKNRKPEGFSILAPMADVTDNPFRKIISEIGRPDMFYTEFVASDGLAHPDAKKRLEKQILSYEKNQRPIIAQIFGGNPENYFTAAKLCAELGFDGVDINTGCPQRNILKQIAGSELIKEENRELMAQLIQSAKDGITAAGKNIPLSVKTRIGFNIVDLRWLEFLLQQDIAALQVHLRTKKEMSKVAAHWELMTEINQIRNKIAPKTVLVGNGDILSVKEGQQKCKEHGIDGYMIGRGVFENPTVFTGEDFTKKPLSEKLDILKKHTKYFDAEFPENKEGKRIKNFALLKKFFKIYLSGFDGAKEMRMDLMKAKNKSEVFKKCEKILKENK